MKTLWKVGLSALICVMLFTTAGFAPFVHAAGEMELRIKVGSTQAIINGAKQTIVKPYASGGATMVPLGIFTQAFGSETKLLVNDVVRIKYGSHTVSVVINSKVAYVDGVKVNNNAVSKMVSNTLMVPLRLVAEGLGARVVTGSDHEMIVQMKEGSTSGGSTSGNDKKTKIGNSYYGWTLNKPTDFTAQSTGDESVAVYYGDQTYLEIQTARSSVELDPESLLDYLVQQAKDEGEIILHQQAVPETSVPYARIVVKDVDDLLWEERAYYNDGNVYYVFFGDYDAVTYKDLNNWSKLLGSFRPSFDKKDKTIEDLSAVRNGLREVSNKDYGVTLQIPADWVTNKQGMGYTGQDGSELDIIVASVPLGLNLDSWTDQTKRGWEQRYIPSAYREISSTATKVNGEPAIVLESEYNDGDGWNRQYQLLFMKDGYRYGVVYTPALGSRQTDSDSVFQNIIAMLEINTDAVADFGNVEDNRFNTDMIATVRKKSNKFQYSIDIPQYWMAITDRYELSPVEYHFAGGYFRITAEKSTDTDLKVWQLRSYYAQTSNSGSTVKLEGVENIKLSDVPATLFKVTQTVDGIAQHKQQLLFSKNGYSYQIVAVMNDVNSTEEQKMALAKAVGSFKFIK